MSHGRFGRVLGVAGLVGIMVLPFAAPTTSSADTTPSGLAKASSLSLSLSPQALAAIAIPAQLQTALNALPCGVGTALGSALTQTTTVDLDASSNDGTLNSGATDLVSGEATSSAVHIGLQGIDQVISGVKGILNGDLSCLTGGTSTGLPLNVLSGLGTLQSQLGSLTGMLNGALNPLLGSLTASLNINQVLHTTLDQPPQSSALLNLNAPLIGDLELGPFDAVAVSQAGAQKYNIATGPQLEAHNTTTNLAIGANIPLGLGSLGNIQTTLSQLLATVTGDSTSLTGASNTLGSLNGSSPTSSISGVCGTLAGLIPSLNCSTLPISSNPVGALGTLNGLPLGSLQSMLNNLMTGLPALQDILGKLPNSINLANLIQTGGDTSSVLTQPEKGGVHSLATDTLADLKVLQLGSGLPGIGSTAPLLEVKLMSSSSEAFVNGTDTSAPTGTVSLGEVDVLGQALKLSGIGTNQSITVPTPLGDLTLVISVGTPQTINNTPDRKTVQASALTIALINGDAGGNSPITLLGGKGGNVLSLQIAGTQVDDAMTAVAVQTGTQAACTTCNAPSTGMLGPIGFAGVGLLGLTGAGLRIASRRSRRAAGGAADASDSEPLSID